MSYSLLKEGDLTVISLRDSSDTQELRTVVCCAERFLSDGTTVVEMDLKGLTYLPWEAVGVLAEACKQARKRGVQIRVRNISPGLRRTVEALGASKLLGMTEASRCTPVSTQSAPQPAAV